MSTETGQSPESTLVEFWKSRFQRQRLIVNSITSLFDRYGDSVDVEHLYSAFVLTLMGHYVVCDACYYEPCADGSELVPAVAYGRWTLDELPSIPRESRLVAAANGDRSPRLLSSLGPRRRRGDRLRRLAESYHLVAPLHIKQQLVGLLFLGQKVSQQSFSDQELEVLNALCAASATTFNNALLCRNARLSARELESICRVRSDLISHVSHEFRTPLTAIRAILDLAGSRPIGPDGREILRNSVDRLDELVNTLIQLDDGVSPDAPADYDPVAVVQDSITRAAEQARDKGIRLEIRQAGKSKLPSPRISPEDLTVVVDALLDNSIKFSDPDSVVRLEVAHGGAPDPAREGVALLDWRDTSRELADTYARVADGRRADHSAVHARSNGGGGEAGTFLVVRVSDDGIGIPAEDISLVSEPFRQASNSPDLGVKGRGLGLSIVQKVVARCRGKVFCRSEVGGGTTMTVYLPAD